MARFSDAAKKGLDAHRRAAAARKQVEEILAQASSELSEVLETPVALGLKEEERTTREQSNTEAMMGIPAPKEKVTALTIKTKKYLSRLAWIEFDSFVFPVTLRWADRSDLATDAEGFETMLVNFLESPETGRELARLAKWEAANTNTNTEPKESAPATQSKEKSNPVGAPSPKPPTPKRKRDVNRRVTRPR